MHIQRLVLAGSVVCLTAASAAGCGLDDYCRGDPDQFLPAIAVTGEVERGADPDGGGPLQAESWRVSDPRLSGQVTYAHNEHTFGGSTEGERDSWVAANSSRIGVNRPV